MRPAGCHFPTPLRERVGPGRREEGMGRPDPRDSPAGGLARELTAMPRTREAARTGGRSVRPGRRDLDRGASRIRVERAQCRGAPIVRAPAAAGQLGAVAACCSTSRLADGFPCFREALRGEGGGRGVARFVPLGCGSCREVLRLPGNVRPSSLTSRVGRPGNAETESGQGRLATRIAISDKIVPHLGYCPPMASAASIARFHAG
jgi:hypothetical protein